MKNLKTKIGISLAVLTCFLALSAGPVKAGELKKDQDVMNVVDAEQTLQSEPFKSTYQSGYIASDGRDIRFNYIIWSDDYNGPEKSFFEVSISKPKVGRVTITDYDLNYLDSNDEILYEKAVTSPAKDPSVYEKVGSLKFGELSDKTQRELREEYSAILKEAPDMMLKEYKEEKSKFENSVMEVVRPKN